MRMRGQKGNSKKGVDKRGLRSNPIKSLCPEGEWNEWREKREERLEMPSAEWGREGGRIQSI
jgi:hypothetical protein